MAAITWTSLYSVKVQDFDEQHQKLFELINEFYDNVVSHSNDELILKLVKGMREYVQNHFNNEETMMVKYNYPMYSTHKQQHDSFIQKVTDLENKLNHGVTIISFEITSFLKDWIKTHILNTDKLYSEFFNKLGIE